MIIYKSTCLINNKIYIGETTLSLDERMKRHLRKSLNPKYKFHRALKKYGPENFKWEIIEECTDLANLLKREKFWIKELKSNNSNFGYNIASGGQGTHDNHKNGMVGKKGNLHPRFGKKHSKKTKRILREKLSGKNSPMYGRKGKLHPMYGKTFTYISKLINLDKILQFSKDGKFIKEWENITILKGKFNTDGIKRCCNGHRKTYCGYIWIYSNNYTGSIEPIFINKNIKLERCCPNCNNIITYSNVYNLNKAIENNSECRSCRNSGEKNPMSKKNFSHNG